MPKRRNSLQVSLSTLMILILLAAFVAAFPAPIIYFIGMVYRAGPVLGLVTFLIVHRIAHSNNIQNQWPTRRGWLAMALTMLPIAMAWFIRRRWAFEIDDDHWPRPFPYPDMLLLQLHDTWDRMHPAPETTFKIHGEYYAVLFFTGVLLVVTCIVGGAICGYTLRHVSLVGQNLFCPPSRPSRSAAEAHGNNRH